MPTFLDGTAPRPSVSSVVATRARPTPTSRPTEIRALTGARFFPVLFIVVFHYHEWYGYTDRYWIDLFVVKGYLWVEFFFSLSGFILYYVYGRRLAARFDVRAVGAFLAARISRIYPLQLATLLAGLFLELDQRITTSRQAGLSFFEVPPTEGRSALTFLSNLFMVAPHAREEPRLAHMRRVWPGDERA